MPFRIKNPEKIVRVATIATLLFMICWGLVSVLFEIRPFWVDEWRIMYNLKFKTGAALWGPLDFMQQFPRVYIELLKTITAAFHFSYFGLRLPSYIVGSFTMIFCYRVMNRIFPAGHFNKFLFVMILVSCSTFTLYFVQIKQYTMDILLSVVAVWQLVEVTDLPQSKTRHTGRYVLLCLTFLVAPFFSYIYPVAVAPVYMVVFLQSFQTLKDQAIANKVQFLFLQWLPLFLCAISIGVFYSIDVSQLLADQGMREWWGELLLDKGFSWSFFFYTIFNLFAEIGAGLVYWILFGILGTLAFIYCIYTSTRNFYKNKNTFGWLRLYSVSLLILVLILFLTKKLPVGEPRLNAFTIPAISILIIYFLDEIKQNRIGNKISWGVASLLYIGLIGNIYTTFFAAITGEAYAKEMNIYRSTEKAILLAKSKKLPILITPGVAYPYEKTRNLPYHTTVPGDWVLKSFPAYNPADSIPVYPIDDLNNLNENMNQLPSGINAALAGDGISFRIINR